MTTLAFLYRPDLTEILLIMLIGGVIGVLGARHLLLRLVSQPIGRVEHMHVLTLERSQPARPPSEYIDVVATECPEPVEPAQSASTDERCRCLPAQPVGRARVG